MTANASSQPKKKRGPRGQGTVYWEESKQCYVAEKSFGYLPSGKRDRVKGHGKTKSAARDDLKRKLDERERGVTDTTNRTVRDAVEGFISEQAALGHKAERTIESWRSYANNHVLPGLGAAKLRGRNALTEHDVSAWLIAEAESLSDSMVGKILSLLRRSLAWAKRHKWMVDNVARDVEAPKGQKPGRPRKSAQFDQLSTLVTVARTETHGLWIWPYLVLCVLTGIRAEEVRRLEWTHVVLQPETRADGTCLPPHVRIWKSVRTADRTKTAGSYRSVELPAPAVEVMRWWKTKQVDQRQRSQHDYANIRFVFGTRDDKLRSHANVRRRLYQLCDKAQVARIAPSETRNTFVSIMSALGGSEELIADICGHATPTVTRTVYRDELRPVITGGANLIGTWFADLKELGHLLGHLLGPLAPRRSRRRGAFVLVVDTGIEPVTPRV